MGSIRIYARKVKLQSLATPFYPVSLITVLEIAVNELITILMVGGETIFVCLHHFEISIRNLCSMEMRNGIRFRYKTEIGKMA